MSKRMEPVSGRTPDSRQVGLALVLGVIAVMVAVVEVGLAGVPASERAIGLIVAVALVGMRAVLLHVRG